MIIEKFDKEYQEIISKDKEGKEISEEVKKYVIKVLKEIIDSWEGLDISSREELGEEAGDMSIRLLSIDEFKIKKELDKIIFELADIENSKAMKEIDRISLIKKVHNELENF